MGLLVVVQPGRANGDVCPARDGKAALFARRLHERTCGVMHVQRRDARYSRESKLTSSVPCKPIKPGRKGEERGGKYQGSIRGCGRFEAPV